MPFDFLPPEEHTQHQLDLRVLRRVLQALSMPGSWIRGSYESFGRRCAIGWLQVYANHQDIERIACLYLVPVLPWRPLPWRLFGGWQKGESASQTIVFFNDRQKSRDRVVKLFERAIQRAERV